MVYFISYKDGDVCQTLYDIEFYMNLYEHAKDERKWQLEIHVTSSLNCCVDYILKHINEDNKDEFIEDCKVIDELRGFMWEKHSNIPRTIKECGEFEDIVMPEIEKRIYGFAKKWNLKVDTD